MILSSTVWPWRSDRAFMSSSRCVCCDQNAGSSWDMLMSQMWVSARSDTVNWTHYHSCDTDLHFNEGCRGGGESVQSRQTHTRSQTHAMREGWNLKHTSALPNICNVLVKPDVTTSHLSLQLRFCRSHRCCKMLFSYLGAEKNKYCSVELQWSREPSHFLCISSGLAHVQGRTYYRSTSNKQPGPAEVSSRFIYLKGFYEIYADLEHQLLRNMFKCQPNWQQISDQRNLLTTAETTSKSPASR